MSDRITIRTDRILRIVTHPPTRPQPSRQKRWTGLGAGVLVLALGLLALAASRETDCRQGEREERRGEKIFLSQTDVQNEPRASAEAPGWDSERVWSGQDDWEPSVVAGRSSH